MSGNSASSWTLFELGTAFELIRLLPSEPTNAEGLRASFGLVTTGGLIRVAHLERAYERLVGCGLLTVQDQDLKGDPRLLALRNVEPGQAVELLAALVLGAAPPLWLRSVAEGPELASEMIPEADWNALQVIFPDPERREQMLLALARRFDDSEDRLLGEAGEVAVVEFLKERLTALGRADLCSGVTRVSQVSDQLGYDVVCPTLSGSKWRLEVKTTRRARSPLAVNISRNEARVGLADEGWALLACRANEDGVVRIIGWGQGELLRAHLPADLTARGEWTSARLYIDEFDLSPDIPDLLKGPGSNPKGH